MFIFLWTPTLCPGHTATSSSEAPVPGSGPFVRNPTGCLGISSAKRWTNRGSLLFVFWFPICFVVCSTLKFKRFVVDVWFKFILCCLFNFRQKKQHVCSIVHSFSRNIEEFWDCLIHQPRSSVMRIIFRCCLWRWHNKPSETWDRHILAAKCHDKWHVWTVFLPNCVWWLVETV